jgi:hypothetical protein
MSSVIDMRPAYPRRQRPRWTVKNLLQRLRGAWRRMLGAVIANFPPDAPQPSPPLAKAAALREGALLSENVDARSTKHVA